MDSDAAATSHSRKVLQGTKIIDVFEAVPYSTIYLVVYFACFCDVVFQGVEMRKREREGPLCDSSAA